MMRALAFALLLLAGCGGSPPDDNHGYGFEYDAQGAAALKLRYTPVYKASALYSDTALFEKIFYAVEKCTGMSAPMPPFIIIVPTGTLGAGQADGTYVQGRYYTRPSLIIVDAQIVQAAHEMIHYLFDYSTGDQDHYHQSEFFKTCSDGIVITQIVDAAIEQAQLR